MKYISGEDFKGLLEYGFLNLMKNKEIVDNLNVFPVPDGDTGTNMLLTYRSGYNAIKDLEGSIGKISKDFSKGLLMGARGNSGVITSQIFRGMSSVFQEHELVDCNIFVEALISASKTAYKGVMSPVEGTILTVIRETSIAMKEHRELEDFSIFIKHLVRISKEVLDNTPNLLPILKEAGVVDSGGYGLVVIFEGFQKFILHEEIGEVEPLSLEETVQDYSNPSEEEFGYCTEFIIEIDENKIKENTFNEDMLKQQLLKIGDSLAVVYDENIVKVHVHTLYPGQALNIGQKYGEFLKLKIENMTLQHQEIIKPATKSKYAILSVSNGEGIKKLFYDLGVTKIISGGQTMNSSTQDFIEKIKEVNAENIIILPNNSNIIMAAEQACSLVEDKNVGVVKTKSVMQALVALTFFDEEADLETNLEEMTEAYRDLVVGEVTHAVRNTVMNDVEIKIGDYISITDKEVICADKSNLRALELLLAKMCNENTELLTVVYGKEVSEDDKRAVEEYVSSIYPDIEAEFHDGGQEVYYFYVSCE